MATNLTERVTELISLDNQLISVVEDKVYSSPGVFESQVCPAIFALHHIDSTLELVSYVHQFGGSHTAEHVKQTVGVLFSSVGRAAIPCAEALSSLQQT